MEMRSVLLLPPYHLGDEPDDAAIVTRQTARGSGFGSSSKPDDAIWSGVVA